MLQPILKAYQRRRRPLNDHHFMVLERAGLAYGRCPNAADDAIRRSLLRIAGAKHSDELAYATGTLRDWTDGLKLVSARQLTRVYAGVTVFTILRDPATRLAACYLGCRRQQVPVGPGALSGDDGFAAFVAAACATPDWKSPNGFRSQSAILTYKGRLLPRYFVRYENRVAEWRLLRQLIADSGGADIGFLPDDEDADAEVISSLLDDLPSDLAAGIRRRYRTDYELFYPGTEPRPLQACLKDPALRQPRPAGPRARERV